MLSILSLLFLHKFPKKSDILTPAAPSPRQTQKIVPPVGAQKIVWNKTPEEQGLNVGDWITIDGYQRTYIGASAKIENGDVIGLNWHYPDPNSNQKLGGVYLWSQSNANPLQTDRIKGILGFVDENTVGKIPLNNDDLVEINYAIMKWHAAGLQDRPRVRITAQISQIRHEPDYFPNQWAIYCMKAGAYVEFLSEK